MESIATLLLTPRPGDSVVAWDRKRVYRWSDLCADVARMAQRLRVCPPGRVALYTDNAYWCAVGMQSCFQAQRHLLLLPNTLPATLALLKADDVLVTDIETAYPAVTLTLQDDSSQRHLSDTTFSALQPADLNLDILTSGSTGEPKLVHKTLAQFDAEVVVLESLWGALLDGCRVLGSVSHQHVYGILFRVLWPLMAGRPFAAFVLEYPEQIAQHPFPVVLVSSPAFLKRIGQAPAPGNLNLVFSSGGPLDEALNLYLSEQWRIALWEVFGSSETGGVAIRQLTRQTLWQLMPGVYAEIRSEGQLWVDSPFVASDQHQMADRAEILEHGLRLLGRADRIVKLEEKRLSLTAVEHSASSMPAVEKAYALILPGRRELLGLMVTLSAAGRQIRLASGAGTVKKMIREHLAAEFEAVALPRKIRLVDAFPETAQGKLDRQTVLEWFENVEDAEKYPRVIACELNGNKLSAHVVVPDNCVWFKGHFDQAPILSGVAQIDWVMEMAQVYLGIVSPFQGVEVLKFQQVIQPGDQLVMELEYQVEKSRLVFAIRSNGPCSSGRILLTGAPTP